MGTRPEAAPESPGERDWSDVIPTQALNDIKALAAIGPAHNNVANAAKILARHMDKPGFEGHLGHMLDFLRTNYGAPALDQFVQPPAHRQLFQRMGNAFGPPSEEEVVASQLRNAMKCPLRIPTQVEKLMKLFGGNYPG